MRIILATTVGLVLAVTLGVAAWVSGGGQAELSATGTALAGGGQAPTTEPPRAVTTTTPDVTALPSTTTVTQAPVRPATTITTPTTVAATTTTAPARPPLCTPATTRVTVETDKPSYRQGEEIIFTYRARNESGATCQYPRYQLLLDVFDASGQPVVNTSYADPSPGQYYPDPPSGYFKELAPGQSMVSGFGRPANHAGTFTYRLSIESFGAASVTRTVSAA